MRGLLILSVALISSVLADKEVKSMLPRDPDEEQPIEQTNARYPRGLSELDQDTAPATLVSVPHESTVAGRAIPQQHHHSVHWRPDPGPDYDPYQPVSQFHYTPTAPPPKIYKPLPTPPPTTAKPRYYYDKSTYYGQELYSEGCGCIPYRIA